MLKEIKSAESSECGRSSPDPKSSAIDGGVVVVSVKSPGSRVELGSQSRSS